MNKKYKKLSSHGSISIPVDMRREIGIQGGDPMEVSLEADKITVKPYTPRCIFCESTDNVKTLYGKGICADCAEKVLDKLK